MISFASLEQQRQLLGQTQENLSAAIQKPLELAGTLVEGGGHTATGRHEQRVIRCH